MQKWQKITLGVVAGLLIVAGGFFGYASKQNQPPQLVEPNYYTYYKTQDMTPAGKIGVFVSHLVMPEHYREEDYQTIAAKSLQYIPWPIRSVLARDGGTALLDEERYYERAEFVPTKLVDQWGSDTAKDGAPYIDLYTQGKVEWVAPSETAHLGHGYFLYPDQPSGSLTAGSKLAVKAKNYYHKPGAGFTDGRVPHEAVNRIFVEGAMNKIRATYGDVPYRWVTADNPTMAREALFSLLDEGIDTLILAAPRPVYSHHEEFNGSIKHAMHYLHDWQDKNGRKDIKVIISKELSHYEPMYLPHQNLLRYHLDQLPQGASVKVVISVHGMAWDLVPHEAWIELAPRYVDRVMAETEKTMAAYQFSKTDIVQSQDRFADPYNNPNGVYLSTNKAFWDGINDGFDYVINLPIEFFAENTDTMFSHAMYNFENFDDFDHYETVDYPDWSKPYIRSYVQDGTKVIYGGLVSEQFGGPIIDAFYMALDDIISQGMEPLIATSATVQEVAEEVVEAASEAVEDAAATVVEGIVGTASEAVSTSASKWSRPGLEDLR